MLASARFLRPRWPYEPYALARDAAGKPLKLTNAVTYSAGDVLVTRTGQLRLSESESAWVEGKRQTRLVVMPLDDNAVLIYRDLGVYVGEPLGTPCDDL